MKRKLFSVKSGREADVVILSFGHFVILIFESVKLCLYNYIFLIYNYIDV